MRRYPSRGSAFFWLCLTKNHAQARSPPGQSQKNPWFFCTFVFRVRVDIQQYLRAYCAGLEWFGVLGGAAKIMETLR
jgi:hypothetical protein